MLSHHVVTACYTNNLLLPELIKYGMFMTATRHVLSHGHLMSHHINTACHTTWTPHVKSREHRMPPHVNTACHITWTPHVTPGGNRMSHQVDTTWHTTEANVWLQFVYITTSWIRKNSGERLARVIYHWTDLSIKSLEVFIVTTNCAMSSKLSHIIEHNRTICTNFFQPPPRYDIIVVNSTGGAECHMYTL
jgi:hypothetical protein